MLAKAKMKLLNEKSNRLLGRGSHFIRRRQDHKMIAAMMMDDLIEFLYFLVRVSL